MKAFGSSPYYQWIAVGFFGRLPGLSGSRQRIRAPTARVGEDSIDAPDGAYEGLNLLHCPIFPVLYFRYCIYSRYVAYLVYFRS